MKIIEPDFLALLKLEDATLSALSALTGKRIAKGSAPLIGAYIVIDGQPAYQSFEHLHPLLQFACEWRESGELCRLYVGSEWHGPLLSWTPDGWCNLYGHGNHGKNGRHGGTWSASGTLRYPTITVALANRDYRVSSALMRRSQMTEGNVLLEALSSLAAFEEQPV
jgi:hypothetical protein